MRLLTLAALIVLPALRASAPDVETFYNRLFKFDRKYETLIHAACGWPDKIEEASPVCRPGEGRFDVKAYREARETAKELFGLVEPAVR